MVVLFVTLFILFCLREDRKWRESDARVVNYYFRSIR